jgi:hypothetical protein
MEAALREGAPNLPKGLAAGLRVIADAFRRYA